MSAANHPYLHREVVLTSKHQKLDLIAPPFRSLLNVAMRELPLDTDQFGTFSGEKERTLSQYESAVAKARLGIESSGIALAIASEGAIGSDPQIPLLNSDLELLVFVDSQAELVIAQSYRSFEIVAVTKECSAGDDLSEFLNSADFPNHGLIVRAICDGVVRAVKGITDINTLKDAISSLISASDAGSVIVESDLRAHYSPSRRANIAKAAQLLAERVHAQCPGCHTPGWGVVSYERGLACSECGVEDGNAVRAEILGCITCDFTQAGKTLATSIDPARCMECNP
jgi:hypothetical protein